MSPFQDSSLADTFVPAIGQAIGTAFAGHLSLFGDLADFDRQALLGIKGRIGIVERGKDVLQAGDKPTHVVVVLSGMLQRYTTDSEGNRQIHSFYLASDVPSLEGLHIDVMDNTLSAVTTSRVAVISHADILAILAGHPGLVALCWRETLIQASIFREWLSRNSQKSADAKTAHLFCEMITRAVAAGISDGKRMALPITQQHLAEALGMSTVHVNRTLQTLRSAGLIKFSQGVLTVHSFSGLATMAGFDPAYLHLPK
jgi:CRP-like cAMP-binding protein